MGPTLQTERLHLRSFVTDDLDEFAALHAQESFWYYPFRRGWTVDETKAFLDRTFERQEAGEPAMSAVVVAETDELAGWAGLAIPRFLPEILPAVEVGWRLGEQHRGRGFATEAGRAWVRYGFEELDLDRIVSIYEPENVASGAVMRRLGFVSDRVTEQPDRAIVVHVMALARDDWQKHEQASSHRGS